MAIYKQYLFVLGYIHVNLGGAFIIISLSFTVLKTVVQKYEL